MSSGLLHWRWTDVEEELKLVMLGCGRQEQNVVMMGYVVVAMTIDGFVHGGAKNF